MQRVAVLAVLFVVAAAGSFISVAKYGAAGCAQGDLKNVMMTTEAAFIMQASDNDYVPEGYTMGECINMTEENVAMSMAISCKAGILAYDVYESDSCEEATLTENVSFDCVDYYYYEDEASFDFWKTTACHDDANGYSEYLISNYDTSDCSGEPSEYDTNVLKDGECVPAAEMDFDTGTWTAGSYKLTEGDGNVTYEWFPSMDCSGTAYATHVTCGECTSEPDDDYSMTVTCPEGTPVDGGEGNGDGGEGNGDGGEGNGDGGEGNGDVGGGNATGPAGADGAFQSSCIMPVLILLAAGSMKA